MSADVAKNSLALQLDNFGDPEHDGVMLFPNFIAKSITRTVMNELDDSEKVQWQDSHEVYTNARGLIIEQNHITYALKLSRGDQAPLKNLPAISAVARHVGVFVRSLRIRYPSLADWRADELCIHRYDRELGLSRHKDNARFVGAIAIASIDGICDLAIERDGQETLYQTNPGDLLLLRAPGLTESTDDLRPEHAVVNLRTPTRTSMMLRANNRPSEQIPGFTFNNWG